MSMLQVKLAVLILLASKMVAGSPCTVKRQAAFCEKGRIVKIPQDLPNNIRYLYLGYSLIKTTKNSDLRRYSQLHLVYINNNLLETVDVAAFAHLTQLKSVSLSHNRLTHVDNTIFINNTNLMSLQLSGNKLLFDPVIPFLISSSIQTLQLVRCDIWQITNATFSKMEKLKFLFISENKIMRLDAASFKYNSLQELYIDFAEEITPTLAELICKNVYVLCNNDLHNFCQVNSTKELKCNLTIPKKATNSPPKEIYSVSASRGKTDSILVGVESTTEVKKEVILNLTRPTSLTNSPPKEIYSVSASPKETVTIPVRAESTTEMTTQTIAMDPALVYVFSSLALISTGLSVTVLVLYLKKLIGKTNGRKRETPSSPEDQFTLVENDEVNDGYEVARNDYLHLVQMQPDILPVWPSVEAPQRPLPSLPVTRCSIKSYHEYEEIRDQ